MLASLLLLVASQAAPPPVLPDEQAPAVARPWRVLLLDCANANGGGRVPAVVTQALTESILPFAGAALMQSPPTQLGGLAQTAGDAPSMARAGSAAGADKVLCALVDSQGAMPPLVLQVVDVKTETLEWSRVAPTDGSDASIRDSALRHGGELGEHLRDTAMHRPATMAPSLAAPAAPAPAPVAPAVAPKKEGMDWKTFRKGAGAALLAGGVALIPLALAGGLFAGAGHIAAGSLGAPQLVLVLPNQAQPRFYNPVFTLTWADVATTLVLAGVGGTAAVVGAVLLAVP